MTCYDEQLKELQQQTARKKHLEKVFDELQSQKMELERRTADLEKIKLREQSDVERLEGTGITSLIYSLVGKKEEKLDKEKQEAYAAVMKYDAAVRELEAVAVDLERCESELQSLWGCEDCYAQVLKEKAEEIKASGVAEAADLLDLEARMTKLESQKTEIKEAISAGRRAGGTAEEVLAKLDDADGWGTWDLLGGGLITDALKHSALDEAQELVTVLQGELRRFRTELADVQIDANLQVNVEGFLRFADYFFDGLFTDWAVLDRISESQKQVKSTKRQIEDVIDQLSRMLTETDAECVSLKEQLDEVIVKARV